MLPAISCLYFIIIIIIIFLFTLVVHLLSVVDMNTLPSFHTLHGCPTSDPPDKASVHVPGWSRDAVRGLDAHRLQRETRWLLRRVDSRTQVPRGHGGFRCQRAVLSPGL